MNRWVIIVMLGTILAGCGRPAPEPGVAVEGPFQLAINGEMVVAEAPVALRVGDTPPDFRYTLPGGQEQRLSDLRGKHIILNFWATWCAPCREEMPALQAAADARPDELVVLGVNRFETGEVIAQYAREVGVTFTLVEDTSGDIGLRYGARALPATYFINRDGIISTIYFGPMDRAFIDEQLGKMGMTQ